jgi:hypothetical protein
MYICPADIVQWLSVILAVDTVKHQQCAVAQEVVRTALVNLYEAGRQQSERMEEMELALKQKANREDVTAALSQKASAFQMSSQIKKVHGTSIRIEKACIMIAKPVPLCDVFRPQKEILKITDAQLHLHSCRFRTSWHPKQMQRC